jgi:DNA-binding response OmpR family regulator
MEPTTAAPVLIVSERDWVQDFLGKVLDRAGYRSLKVGDEQWALLLANTFEVGLIIVDLPPFEARQEGSYWAPWRALFESLRAHYPPELPAIALADRGRPASEARWSEFFGAGVLEKPVKVSELLERVASGLRGDPATG